MVSIKSFLLTFAAVAVGIFVYVQLTKRKREQAKTFLPDANAVYNNSDGKVIFAGPDIDPLTGAYTGPGARTGTVQFSAQGN